MGDLAYRKLSDDEIAAGLSNLEGWAYNGGQIHKSFAFDSYQEGLVFATTVGLLADRLNHHPDLTIGYRKVHVGMNTHDVGGISPYDFELARRIDSL